MAEGAQLPEAPLTETKNATRLEQLNRAINEIVNQRRNASEPVGGDRLDLVAQLLPSTAILRGDIESDRRRASYRGTNLTHDQALGVRNLVNFSNNRFRDLPSRDIVDLADMAGELFLQFAHPGGGGGRNDDFEIRQAWFQHPDKLCANVDFPYADRVHPQRMTVGNGLPKLRVVLAEPLSKPGQPVAAALHSREVIRQR